MVLQMYFDKICMMTRLACNRPIESSYWKMDNDSDVGLLTSYVLYQLLVELDTLLCAQVDRIRYSSIASGNNCIVQLVSVFHYTFSGLCGFTHVLIACSFASVGFFGNNKSSTQMHGSLSLKQLKATIL